MPRLLFTMLLSLALGPLTGCTYVLAKMWTPPKLDTDIAYTRSAEEDVQLLDEMFEGHAMPLWGETTQSVRCVETDVFRMFECDEHYVVIYPPNWTKRKYSIMLLPGPIPELEERNRASTFLQDHAEEKKTNRWMPTPALIKQRAGLDHAYLGMPIQDFSNAYQQDKTVRYDDRFARHQELGYADSHSTWGWWTRAGGAGQIESALTYGEGQYHVVDYRIFEISFERGGAMTLNHVQLSRHPVVIVDEKEITLPAATTNE